MKDVNKIEQEHIVILDTSLSTTNLGNKIIMESIYKVLYRLLDGIDDKNFFIVKIPIYTKLTNKLRKIIRSSKLVILGGTNIFHFYYLPLYNNTCWSISFRDINYYNNKLLLFGVGTSVYKDSKLVFYKKPLRKVQKLYSKYLWKKILIKDSNIVHSIRDNESLELFLKDLNINNVVNTGCPTLWDIKNQDKKLRKNDSVIFTLTDYNKNFERDTLMLKTLLNNYEELFFWPQGFGDLSYLKEIINKKKLNFKKIKILSCSLKEYDVFLENNNVDYVGTRLHAGIRALQKNKRTYIVAVDNRAKSFKRDFNVPIIENIKNLEEYIWDTYKINIKLNKKDIDLFLNKMKTFLKY